MTDVRSEAEGDATARSFYVSFAKNRRLRAAGDDYPREDGAKNLNR
jgi:hypothetical protein